MKKLFLGLFAGLSLVASAQADVLSGTYNFNSFSGSASGVSGATFSSIASAGITPVTTTYSSGAMATSNWPRGTGQSTPGTFNADQYVGFTVTPSNGGWNSFDISLQLAFNARISQFSPYSNGAIVQIGLYQNGVLVSGSQQQIIVNSQSMTGFNYSGGGQFSSSSPVEIRISSVSGSGQGQTVTFDDMVISGDVTLVPEPTNIALGIMGVSFGGVVLRRRWLKKKNATNSVK